MFPLFTPLGKRENQHLELWERKRASQCYKPSAIASVHLPQVGTDSSMKKGRMLLIRKRLYLGSSKITADGDFSHEINRRLLLEEKL